MIKLLLFLPRETIAKANIFGEGVGRMRETFCSKVHSNKIYSDPDGGIVWLSVE